VPGSRVYRIWPMCGRPVGSARGSRMCTWTVLRSGNVHSGPEIRRSEPRGSQSRRWGGGVGVPPGATGCVLAAGPGAVRRRRTAPM